LTEIKPITEIISALTEEEIVKHLNEINQLLIGGHLGMNGTIERIKL